MPKKLKIKDITPSYCMTRKELIGWLTSNPSFTDTSTIILKCNGRNYRLGAIETIAGRPMLIGKRGMRDS
jgi:hypothetical protein